MIKAVFCEGDYDLQVVQKIFVGLSPPPLPVRTYGKYGMKAFMQGYLDGHRVQKLRDNEIIGFRDRDFDYPVPAQVQLIVPNVDGRPDRKMRVSYRTTIENYLLTSRSLFSYCHGISEYRERFPTESEIGYVFKQAAGEILAYQAARHALGAMRIVPEQKTNLMEQSGLLPKNLGEDSCRAACKDIIGKYSTKIAGYSPEAFDACYDQFLRQFREPSFLGQAGYEIYFHGKDLQAALFRLLPGRFSFKSFYKDSLGKFDYTQFGDLVELRNIVANGTQIDD